VRNGASTVFEVTFSATAVDGRYAAYYHGVDVAQTTGWVEFEDLLAS
jgi:hypothetical protein